MFDLVISWKSMRPWTVWQDILVIMGHTPKKKQLSRVNESSIFACSLSPKSFCTESKNLTYWFLIWKQTCISAMISLQEQEAGRVSGVQQAVISGLRNSHWKFGCWCICHEVEPYYICACSYYCNSGLNKWAIV